MITGKEIYAISERKNQMLCMEGEMYYAGKAVCNGS